MQSRAVAATVLALGGLLGVSTLIYFMLFPEPDYADLVPAPDSVVWQEGDEITAWLNTNRHDVDLRIDSVAIGIGDIDRAIPGLGEITVLGQGIGCQDYGVTRLRATDVANTSYIVRGGD